VAQAVVCLVAQHLEVTQKMVARQAAAATTEDQTEMEEGRLMAAVAAALAAESQQVTPPKTVELAAHQMIMTMMVADRLAQVGAQVVMAQVQ
tara:strand:+ start:288 stop:563 length:276 start_codon:yes stop_codon:yes gene_type:complete